MEKIQAQKDLLQTELLACRTELEGLRVALTHVQNTNKALSTEKVSPALRTECPFLATVL